MKAPDEVIGQTEVRWGAGVSEEDREAFRKKLAAIAPRRPSRPISPARARALAEQRGASALSDPDVPEVSEKRRWTVRIYYRSMGGDLLAFDCPRLTGSQASTLRGMYRAGSFGNPSDAVDADSWQDGDEPPTRNARVVVLPSQRTESVESHEEVSEPPMLPLAPVLSASRPPPRNRYQEAMTQRAQRISRWRGGAVAALR